MQEINRILDANANRAREALRVMEETARFILNDPSLSATLKAARHDLAAALASLPPIINARNTAGDVGTSVQTTSEYTRTSIEAVTIAAGKRLTEALRCLEEYAKIQPQTQAFARRIEQLRYRGYDIEKALALALAARQTPQWRLCVLISESMCHHHSWFDIAQACLAAGADCIQLREKSLEAAQLLDRATQLVELANQNKKAPAIIINDRVDIALASGARGVHLGQSDLSIQASRKLATSTPSPFAIGISTHNLAEAKRAIASGGAITSGGGGADYCGVGAMYPTSTKNRKPSGLPYLKRFIRDFPQTPHLAIGGITPQNAPELAQAGAQGLAVSSIVCNAKKPATVVRQLLRAFR